MSIDKSAKTDKVDLHSQIWFGIFKGSVPAKLIKSTNIEGIKYLLWMRTVRNERGFPRFMFDEELHHVLDQVLRLNESVSAFAEYSERYTETQYTLWLAQKRIEKKKAEAAKQERIIKQREEIAKFQEEERIKSLRIKRQQEAYLAEQAAKKLRLQNLEADRAKAYDSEWGGW